MKNSSRSVAIESNVSWSLKVACMAIALHFSCTCITLEIPNKMPELLYKLITNANAQLLGTNDTCEVKPMLIVLSNFQQCIRRALP